MIPKKNLPVGTLVQYWKGSRNGSPSGIGKTRSEVTDFHGEPVVWIEGVLGFIALSHIEIVPPIPPEAA